MVLKAEMSSRISCYSSVVILFALTFYFDTFSIDCIDAIFDGLLGEMGHSDTLT